MFHDAGLEKLQRRTSQDDVQSDQIQDSLIFLVYITHQVLNYKESLFEWRASYGDNPTKFQLFGTAWIHKH
jgi:hypothetical protein